MNSSKSNSNQNNDKNTNNSQLSTTSGTTTQTKTQIETKNDLSAEPNHTTTQIEPNNSEQKQEEVPISSNDQQLEIEKQQQDEEQLALKLKLKEEKRNCIKLFLSNYCMREIVSSDYDSLLSLCNSKHYLHKQFFTFLHDDKCLFYGCVDKNTNTIIGSICIKIIDGGYTAQIMAAVIDKNYVTNICNTLIEYVMNISYIKYPSINRFRYIKVSNEMENQIQFDINSIGFEILNDIQFMYCILCNDIVWFENKLNKIHNGYINNKLDSVLYNEYLCNFEELKCRDIDNIICILLYYYKQPHIFIEWNIFDLGINENETTDEESEDITAESTHENEMENNNEMDINDENSENNSDNDNESEHENENDNDNEINEAEDDILGGGYEVIDNNEIEEKQSVLNRLASNERSRSTSYSRSNDEDLYGDEQDISEDDSSIDGINEIISNNYNEKDICVSSISDFKSYLFDFMNCGNIQVYGINTNDMNQEHGALCFKYRNIKVRDMYTYYHIFGNKEMGIISMIYSCYYLWKKNIYNKNKNENIQIFVNRNVILNNNTLKWLFENTNNAWILEKGIDDLESDIYNDLLSHEK